MAVQGRGPGVLGQRLLWHARPAGKAAAGRPILAASISDWYVDGFRPVGLARELSCHGEIIDSLRGEDMLDGQDAGPDHSGLRAGFGSGDRQVLGRQGG